MKYPGHRDSPSNGVVPWMVPLVGPLPSSLMWGTRVVPRQPHERACVGGGAGARGTQGLPGGDGTGIKAWGGLEGITSNWRYHIWGRRPPDMAGGMNILMGIRTRIPAEIIQGVSSRDGIHAGAERHLYGDGAGLIGLIYHHQGKELNVKG